ncbi:MAG: tetratricopeptide repeat protein [Thermoplasmata archaeon]
MPLLGRRSSSQTFMPSLRDLIREGRLEARTDPTKAKVTLRKIIRMISDADPSEQMAIEQNKDEVINILLEAGAILEDLGDKEKSIEFFEKVKEMNPNNPRPWFEIGRILANQNIQIPYATVNIKKSLELDPNNALAMIILGDIYKLQKDYKNALKWYKDALKINPEKGEVLDRILSLDPFDKEALRQKLEYLLERGDKEGAAQIYLQLGIIENNIDLIDEGIKNSPNNVSLLKEKARMLINKGRKSEAQQFIERVKKLSPNDPEIPILEDMISEKKVKVEEDIFGDLGIGPEVSSIDQKEPDENVLENILNSGNYKEILNKYANSETFVKNLDNILSKNIENYDFLIPALDEALKSGIKAENLTNLRSKLGQVFDAINLFNNDKIEDAEKILNNIVLKDQKNALAWFYKARIAAIKKNTMGAKNFLLMAKKLGKFDESKFPDLEILK